MDESYGDSFQHTHPSPLPISLIAPGYRSRRNALIARSADQRLDATLHMTDRRRPRSDHLLRVGGAEPSPRPELMIVKVDRARIGLRAFLGIHSLRTGHLRRGLILLSRMG
ncbi:hypothetical protein NIIDNTM18_10060 [Mycolicibacterium litorale]|uniref:Uncharacterized protein n=1 Tax=Mycolicibacterium litorale TaxID=758802 RepID=A0A6S6P600_9MYCO|nr:hypothetical protein NIIDNTM18_10060 [Mycolicibacterium litorale]